MRIQLLMVLFLMSTGAAALPILTTDGSGNVTGAKGLESGGMTFSMEFVDGTCINLFDGCNADSDFLVDGTSMTHGSLLFTFYNAFISPVISSDDGSLDARPSTALGCSHGAQCFILAPRTLDVLYVNVDLVANFDYQVDSLDRMRSEPYSIEFDSSADSGDDRVWARFSKSPTGVPTPGSLALVALGLAGLGLIRKGKTA